VFLDEFGCNTAMTRRFSRSLQGQRAYGSCPVNYGTNVSVVGAVRLEGVVEAMILEGAFDGESFLAYIAEFLAPALRPGDVVVMDNLASHKVTGVVAAVEAVGARVLYLPPYSPDFNPIEMAISKIKTLLRSLEERTVPTLRKAIGTALASITTQDAINYIQHCRYDDTNR